MTDDGTRSGHRQHDDAQFDRLVEEISDYAIFMLDLEGHVRTWNEGARRIKGYTAAEIIGRHFSTFYPDEAAEDGLPDRLLREARTEGRTEHEGWRVRKDGSRFWANVTITAIHDDDGALFGYAKVTRDLTERRRHERRLEQFAHAVSHDLRQPLRTMTVDLELVEQGASESLDAQELDLLRDAIEGAERMHTMVEGLLAYARTETDEGRFELVEAEAVVDDAIRDLAAMVEERNAEITVGSLPAVRGDREQLHVLFQNLLENALKYTEDGPPCVHVDADRTDGQWRISVADNGMGIDAGATEDIFRLFERSHRVEESEGIGLGLALCKQIVEQHDGNIWVESPPGDGATFYVTLPASA